MISFHISPLLFFVFIVFPDRWVSSLVLPHFAFLGFLQDSRVVGRIQHEMLKKTPDLNKISNNFTPCRQLSFAWCLLCPCLLFGLGPWVIPDILWLLILSIHNIGTRFGALIFWTSHLGSGFKDDTRLKLDSRGSLESLLNMPLLNPFHGGMNDNYILAGVTSNRYIKLISDIWSFRIYSFGKRFIEPLTLYYCRSLFTAV